MVLVCQVLDLFLQTVDIIGELFLEVHYESQRGLLWRVLEVALGSQLPFELLVSVEVFRAVHFAEVDVERLVIHLVRFVESTQRRLLGKEGREGLQDFLVRRLRFVLRRRGLLLRLMPCCPTQSAFWIRGAPVTTSRGGAAVPVERPLREERAVSRPSSCQFEGILCRRFADHKGTLLR